MEAAVKKEWLRFRIRPEKRPVVGGKKYTYATILKDSP